AGVPAAGRGVYTESEGLDLTLSQLLDADVGGRRNHFGRAIRRDLRLHLGPTAAEAPEGASEARTFGIFAQPSTAHGTIQLRTRPLRESLDLPLPAPVTMPGVTASALVDGAFGERMTVPTFAQAKAALPASCQSGVGDDGCIAALSDFFYGGL